MPQNHRSIAFSNKKKKEQLKSKRERKKLICSIDYDKPTQIEDKRNYSRGLEQEQKISQPSSKVVNKKDASCVPTKNFYLDEVEEIQGGGAPSKSNRYNLKFRKVNKDSNIKKLHYEPIIKLPEEELEVTSATFYPDGMSYPKRPPWTKHLSKFELDQNENRNFRLFCEELHTQYDHEDLSLYELNLETWRQLWRVTEKSDIILVIVDARFVAAQFPPYLYKHLVENENKGVILVINKCDLIHPSLVLAWKDFCKEHYPKLIVVPFSSMEGTALKKTTLKLAMNSSLKLIEACQKLVESDVDLNSWRKKVKKEFEDNSSTQCKILGEHSAETTEPTVYQRYQDDILTIGTIGYPNVGKSSLINALMGKKVVSVSKTPGHTKHFQTIFITNNIKLCDCPGLVFPSLCPKQLQVILGSYPIAQIRDPLSSIHYIASRVDIPFLLRLNVKDLSEDLPWNFEWTPHHICEAWAKKRGYCTKTKGGKPDVFRAANELLRFALVGFKSLVVFLRPLGFSKLKESYISDPRLDEIKMIIRPSLEVERPKRSFVAKAALVVDDSSEEEEDSESDTSEDSNEEEDFTPHRPQNKFSLLTLDDF